MPVVVPDMATVEVLLVYFVGRGSWATSNTSIFVLAHLRGLLELNVRSEPPVLDETSLEQDRRIHAEGFGGRPMKADNDPIRVYILADEEMLADLKAPEVLPKPVSDMSAKCSMSVSFPADNKHKAN